MIFKKLQLSESPDYKILSYYFKKKMFLDVFIEEKNLKVLS